MGDYEDTFHPDGTDGDDVEEMPSQKGWFDTDDDDDDKNDKKGWCFLTTAACDHLGLPDDCAELQVLRGFRDDVLHKSDTGTALVEEYYRIAPELVPFAKDPATASWIWDNVLATVHHIRNDRNDEAIITYKHMVRELQRLLT